MMSLRIFVASAIALAAYAGGIPANEPTLHAGDGTVNGHLLQPYDNVWIISTRTDDGRRDERGLCSDHVRFREIAGKKYLTRAETTTLIGGKPGTDPSTGVSMTFNVFDALTMLPKTGQEVDAEGHRVEHEFGERQVTTTTSRMTENTATNSTKLLLPESVYDFNGGMTGLLLAALPLKVDYRAVLPVLGDNAFDTAEIRVVREETVRAGFRGTIKTFVVEIGVEPAQSTYWISKSSPYVIKAQVKSPHSTASWDMIN